MTNRKDIADYPDCMELDLSHKEIFDSAFRQTQPVISEFTFTNLYCWRKIYDMRVSRFGNFLILRVGKTGSIEFFCPIGTGERSEVMRSILKETGGRFIRVPEEIAMLFKRDKQVSVQEDREHADYLYSSRDLIDLSGRKYDGKRNLIKKFTKNHTYFYINIDVSHTACMAEFQEYWCKLKNCADSPGLSNERVALSEIINNFSSFHLYAGAIKVEDKIRALAIGEKLNPQTLVVHFLKADPSITGLYQVVNNEFMKAHAARFTYVNLEQDLGVTGLRQFKLSYHPVKLIKKFTVSPA